MRKSEGAQFTPGPWVVEEYTRDIKGNKPICVFNSYREICRITQGLGYNRDEKDWTEQEANATLIAAAPAMYASIGDLMGLFDMRLANGLALNQVLPKDVWERVSTVVSIAKQVKAQAEGRQG